MVRRRCLIKGVFYKRNTKVATVFHTATEVKEVGTCVIYVRGRSTLARIGWGLSTPIFRGRVSVTSAAVYADIRENSIETARAETVRGIKVGQGISSTITA